MEATRRCVKCDTIQPIENFHFSHVKRGYRRHECTDCESERKNEWYNANYAREASKRRVYASEYNRKRSRDLEFRKRNAVYQKRYRDQIKGIVYEYYGNKCACCGETERLFLTIDHIDNDGAAMRKHHGHPKGDSAFFSWIIKHDFPKNFQILCANCNFGKQRNGGICPHQKPSTTIPQGSTLKRVEVRHTPNRMSGDDMVSSAMKVAAVE